MRKSTGATRVLRNIAAGMRGAISSLPSFRAKSSMRVPGRQHLPSENTMRAITLWMIALLLSACATPARLLPPPPDGAGEKPILHGAHGALSPERSEAILSEVAKQAGDNPILVRHIRVEEALSRFPLTIGNKVTLLRDGPATYH